MCGKKNSSSSNEPKTDMKSSADVRQMFFSLIDNSELKEPISKDSKIPVHLDSTEMDGLFDEMKDAINGVINFNTETEDEEDNSTNTQPVIFSQWETGTKVFYKNSDVDFNYFYFDCFTGMPYQANNESFSEKVLQKQIDACSKSNPSAKMLFEMGEKTLDEDKPKTIFLGHKDTNGPCEYSFQQGKWQPTGQCSFKMSSNINSPNFPKIYVHASTDGLSPEGNGIVNFVFSIIAGFIENDFPVIYKREEAIKITNGSFE